MSTFHLTTDTVMESLHSALVNDGLIDPTDFEARLGTSQTDPFLVGRVDLGYGHLYILLDREMSDYPAYLVYGYTGMKCLFNDAMRSGLRGFVPILAEPRRRSDSDNNWQVEFTDEANGGVSLVLPMRVVYIASGAHRLLVWARP